LYVMENSPKYFGMSAWGTVKIDEKGSSSFSPDPNGNRAYLTVSKEQATTILNRFIEIITAKPAKLK